MTADEHREYERAKKARQRAALSPEQRSERRRDHDANYRAAHTEDRRAAARAYWHRTQGEKR
jgi:hypothetical protein